MYSGRLINLYDKEVGPLEAAGSRQPGREPAELAYILIKAGGSGSTGRVMNVRDVRRLITAHAGGRN